MTYRPAAPSPQSAPSESDCLQAEFVPVVALDSLPATDFPLDDRTAINPHGTTNAALVALEPTLQATDSVEFNYLQNFPTQADGSDGGDRSNPPDPPTNLLTYLLTPWSLTGLFLLVLANGLLLVNSLSRHTTPPPAAVSGLGELPAVTSIPPTSPQSSPPSLDPRQLSEMGVSPLSPNPTVTGVPPTGRIGGSQPMPPPGVVSQMNAPLPPPPPVSLAARLLPPSLNPQQALTPTAIALAPANGYPTYATARPGAPQPPQPPAPLSTVAVRPVYQPSAVAPLPPPPPPPVSGFANNPAPGMPAPPIATNGGSMTNMPVNAGQDVESQMRQQLPFNPGTSGVPSPSGPQSRFQQGLSRSYNQGVGTPSAESGATQQLVQELESLNQAP